MLWEYWEMKCLLLKMHLEDIDIMDSYIKKIKNNSLPVIKFDSFEKYDYLEHGFTTRLGGVSTGIFSSMNLSFTRGDDLEAVMENYKIISKNIGYGVENFVASDQTHTTNIRVVTSNDRGKGILRERDYHDIDGLMTGEKGIVLFTYYADCVPLYFLDIRNRVIALSHSGWKGTSKGMGRITIEKMCKEFGSRKEDIKCAIGPSICKNCYEVSEELYLEFEKSFDKKDLNMIFAEKENGKYLLDLWLANELILVYAGIPAENIENCRICTCCNKDYLFSHRGLRGQRGNMAAYMVIKD